MYGRLYDGETMKLAFPAECGSQPGEKAKRGENEQL